MAIDKVYQPQKFEEEIYQFWEKKGYFTPKINPQKKPFTIILPLPNANDPLHMGHALFVIEDILIRYHQMLGQPTLWLPGADHAGIETQYVFEKKLIKEGRSRFDFDRKTLYQMIFDFVEKNRQINQYQLKRLGFALDWSRYHYSLEPEIIKKVLATFKKLHQDNLIYRGEKIVNFCTHCGTAFSDLEIKYQEKNDFLYFLDYGAVKIATTRPETIFADMAVAVNPKDKRYQQIVGQKATIPLVDKKIPLITDEAIDINFGTGALKVTPGHDALDFEIGQRHNLKTTVVIDRSGKMMNLPKPYLGLTVKKARQQVVQALKKEGKLIKIEPLIHNVGICYRCATIIEPMLMPQWFVKIKPLAKLAIKAVKDGETKIVPKKRFEKMYFDWLENIHDWNISRQIVWGPQIPVWYCLDCNQETLINFIDKNGRKVSGIYKNLISHYSFEEIKNGLQNLIADESASYFLEKKSCPKCKGGHLLQETDTFDTWFLSGQWPSTTLGFPQSEDFKYFYPTSVLDTLWDILFFWVARMMMFGLYLTGKVPFRIIHLHCRIVDEKGQKMSKSKGNVIDPLEMVEKYGADALRMALVYGASPGSDICLNDDKIRAMRNFANKIWNAGRFILMKTEKLQNRKTPKPKNLSAEDKEILLKMNQLIMTVTKSLNKYRFDLAAEEIYRVFWHEFCDQCLESAKKRIDSPATQWTILTAFKTFLKLLHPFMPFVTEIIWQKIKSKKAPDLMVVPWPKEIIFQ